MSDAAASGGYYISCQADEIIADNFTLTGSIGVYYMRYNFSQLLESESFVDFVGGFSRLFEGNS